MLQPTLGAGRAATSGRGTAAGQPAHHRHQPNRPTDHESGAQQDAVRCDVAVVHAQVVEHRLGAAVQADKGAAFGSVGSQAH